MKINREFIEQMPKTDLHVHLDGSPRLSTILELADKQGVDLPGDPQNEEELKEIMNAGAICEDLTDYLRAFDITLSVLQTKEALYRVAFELGEDAARENVRYMEVRYSPLLHTENGLSYPVIVEAVAEGLREAKRQYGLMSGQIICGIRHMTPEASLRMAELCVAFKNKGVVGFDLAGAEANNPAKDYRDAFYLVRNNNVNLTIHAGEAYGPESIHQALHMGGAHRIGHGTRLREDGDLLNYVNDRRIPLEVCLTSNIQTRACKSFESHPLSFYMSYGIRCTINTDNRLVTDTSVTDEYCRAVQYYDFNIGDLRKLMINGFKSSFLPYRKKKAVIAQACSEFDAVVRRFEEESGETVVTNPQVAQEIAFQKATADARRSLAYAVGPEDRGYPLERQDEPPQSDDSDSPGDGEQHVESDESTDSKHVSSAE